MKPFAFVGLVVLTYVLVGIYQLVCMGFEIKEGVGRNDAELDRMLERLEEKLGSRKRVFVAIVVATIFLWPFYLREKEK